MFMASIPFRRLLRCKGSGTERRDGYDEGSEGLGCVLNCLFAIFFFFLLLGETSVSLLLCGGL